ncbi:uncharacterized protein MYCFIDRAFT_77213 [Pseudocercospora fijiensis CIRAD86]|uniref:Uncharacterized protein n=1 Tax=Pseudocercospora fijiensis (strain CIRAD86) TaxID=383855 RepID=M3BCJ3_PSEFD|nr:uncharacterized protein MYCFIDRAFT_77213 [Pseudocercospora fijiensis CIRAD86]EME86997.1 hypothetical protein MYCFIDRAFT_77213 [Pseudocercospora fijiensis CIRAD86]
MSDSRGRSDKGKLSAAKNTTAPGGSLLPNTNGEEREPANEASAEDFRAFMESDDAEDNILETSDDDELPKPKGKDRKTTAAALFSSSVSTGAGQPPPTKLRWSQAKHDEAKSRTQSKITQQSPKPRQNQTAHNPQSSSSINEGSAQEDNAASDDPVSPVDYNEARKPTAKELAKIPCRKWYKKDVKITSFTGVEWSTPTFKAAAPGQGQAFEVQPGDRKTKSASVEAASAARTEEDEQEAVGDGAEADDDLIKDEEDSEGSSEERSD